MFVGHFGVALAGRAIAPGREGRRGPSLGTFLIAAQWLDLVWPVFVLAGIERVAVEPGNTKVTPLRFESYPWSHSLVMSAVWGIGLGSAWFAARRRLGPALLLGAVVVSHWVLDWITHRPDMPVGIDGPYVGLGLWNSVPATLAAEGVLFLGGLAMYVLGTRPLDRAGRWGLAAFAAFLVVFYTMSLVGPPPPDGRTVAIADLGMWLLVLWAYWIDRHRAPA
jgi:membrane-bound metal-dependent hydrolase YbcI (DUF457 family)